MHSLMRQLTASMTLLGAISIAHSTVYAATQKAVSAARGVDSQPYKVSIKLSWFGGDSHHTEPVFLVDFANDSRKRLAFGPVLDQYRAIKVEYLAEATPGNTKQKWEVISPVAPPAKPDDGHKDINDIIQVTTSGGPIFNVDSGEKRSDIITLAVKVDKPGTYRYTMVLTLPKPIVPNGAASSTTMTIVSNTITAMRDSAGFKEIKSEKQVH